MDLWGLAVAAIVGSAAWLYQRAWERQEKRVARYNEVVSRRHYFTTSNTVPEKQNELIAEHHGLWLFAPDDAIRAGEAFLAAVEGKGASPEQTLGDYILAMRRDASLRSALLPRFWKTSLRPDEFRLRSAAAGKQSDG